MIKRLWGVFLALALFAPALPAAAANQYSISVQPGFGGIVRPGTWAPVEVDVTNSGPNLSGTVEISVQRQATGQGTASSSISAGALFYSVPVVVPQHSSKRFSTAVYVPPYFDQLRVRLAAGGHTLQEQQVNLQRIDPTWTVCGVLSTNQTAYSSLNGLSLDDGQRHPHVVYMDLPDLPSNAELLRSLDCLIVSDYTTRGLTPSQATALSAWVEAGGVLAIGTGATGAATVAGLPSGLLPARLQGTVPVRSLSGLGDYLGVPSNQVGPWLAASLQVTDGTVVAADENQPLLVAGRRGKGAVFMLALSPTENPLRGWSGLNQLWTYILSYVPAAPVFTSYYRQGAEWGQLPRDALIQSGSGLDPNAQRLLLAVGLFALVVGPLSFLLLSRLGRRDVMLWSVPVLAALTTTGALVYANHHRQSDVVVSQVSIARTWDGTGIGLTHSFVGVYALHAQRAQLSAPANSLVSETISPFAAQGIAFQSQGRNGFAGGFSPLQIAQAGTINVGGIDLEPGILRSFAVDGQLSTSGSVGGAITLNGNQLAGSVVNRFPSTLYDVALIANGSVQKIGDLRPGQSGAIALNLGQASPVGYQDTSRIPDLLYPITNRGVRYDILAAAFSPRQIYSQRVELSAVTLIGWLGESLDPVKNPQTGEEARQNILFITSLPVRVPAGPHTIPSQLIEQQTLTPAYGTRSSSSDNRLTINSGETAAFEFSLPVDPPRFATQSLSLNTSTDSSVTGKLDVFNWRLSTWQSVPFSVGNLAIPNADRFVSATGEVRLRFHYQPTSSANTTATFTRFQLSANGSGQ